MTEHFDHQDAPSPSGEASTVLKQFVHDFKGFQDRIETRLRTQEDRVAMLGQKTATVSRPALGENAAGAAPECKALSDYLRRGETCAFESVGERKLLTTDTANGGILVADAANASLLPVRRTEGTLRAVANIVQVEGSVYETLIDRGGAGTAWITESDTLGDTATALIERVTIPLHELAAVPRASQRLLEDAAFDVETWLANSIADTFVRAECQAFINGAEDQPNPRGLLSYTIRPAAEAAWGELGYVATGVEGAFNATDPSDDIVDLVYSVDARYRVNGAFVMNSSTAATIRKMRDVDGRFLWTDRMTDGEPARLFGYPVAICEDMPSIGAGAAAIAFGDFRAGYTIAERPELRILRDPYSAKPHVQFFVSSRVGGAVTDFDAIRFLRFSAN